MTFNPAMWRRILLYCSILIAIGLYVRQCNVTYNDTIKYGGTDLRARIVGTRLISTSFNPYFNKWQPAQGERLCDPNDRYIRPANGVTSTPFLLWLQTPLAHFNYGAIRVAWWVLQQVLLLLIVGLCLYHYRFSGASIAAIALCFGLLINHPAWVYHAERGQIYILYAAWVAVLFSLWRHNHNSRNVIILAAWLGFGLLLRPTLIVFALPAFLYTVANKRMLLVASCGLSIIVLLLITNTWLHWQSYFSAMQFYSNMQFHYKGYMLIKPPLLPAVIEGTTNITVYKQHPAINYLASMEYYFKKIGYKPALYIYAFLCLFINMVLLLLVYFKTRFKLQNEQLLMLGMLFYICADVCQPLRAPYNLVMWLPASLVMAGFIFNKPGNQRLLQMETR